MDTKSKKSTRNMNTNKIPLKANTFQTLDVENSNPSNGYNHKEASQIKRTSKGSPAPHRNRKESNMDPRNTAGSNKRHNQEKQEKEVLVIGDFMVNHIDGNKIARAARNKAISHSYSGVTVNQISTGLMTKQRSCSMTPSSCMLERTTWYMKNQRKLQLIWIT